MHKSILLAAIIATGCRAQPPGKAEEASTETAPDETSPEATQFAQALCAARKSCGCDDGAFASEQECEQEFAERFDNKLARGLELDESCFQATLESQALTECPPWVWVPEQWPCPALIGTKHAGDSCMNHYDLGPLVAYECDDGLVCREGSCTADSSSPAVSEAGDPCHSNDGTACPGNPSLYCGHDDRCHLKGTIGTSCDHIAGCEVPLYCEGLGRGQGICSTRKDPGQSCDPWDWDPCISPDWPTTAHGCDPGTKTCEPDQPGLCRLTHPSQF